MMIHAFNEASVRGHRPQGDAAALLSALHDRVCELHASTINGNPYLEKKSKDPHMLDNFLSLNPIRARMEKEDEPEPMTKEEYLNAAAIAFGVEKP